MESLTETKWDVLISGTGLAQSLLALALSRSGKKVLHIDRNDIYGGPEAALSLQDASAWEEKVNQGSTSFSSFDSVRIHRSDDVQATGSSKLGSPRSYSLSLSPQLIYTQSRLVPLLVSSQTYSTLEFLAVGSWWIAQDAVESNEETSESSKAMNMKKIPSGREDVFADETIDLRSKRALMKFLRSIMQRNSEEAQPEEAQSFAEIMEKKFHLPDTFQQPLLALSLSPASAAETPAEFALDRINRHLRSIGVFGPGFGSLIVKWGGLSEVAQAACRALAVGGGVYVLGRHIESIKSSNSTETPENTSTEFDVGLSNGETIQAEWVIGAAADLPNDVLDVSQTELSKSARAIYIVSSGLPDLFSTNNDNGPPPAGAVVVFPATPASDSSKASGLAYLLVHSSDTGECPHGQCIVYASTSISTDSPEEIDHAHSKLNSSVESLLTNAANSADGQQAKVLWSMHYNLKGISPLQASGLKNTVDGMTPSGPRSSESSKFPNLIAFGPSSIDLSFDDAVIDDVKAAWQKIMGEAVDPDEFMRFESRENILDE